MKSRRSPGDLTRLLAGSEGTLAVVTKIAVRLSPVPSSYATLWAEFPSLESAASAVALRRVPR